MSDMNNTSVIPNNVSVSLLHIKEADKEERTVLPVTIYNAVLSSPNVVANPEDTPGAPFHLYAMETEDMPIKDIRKLCGPII